MTLATTRTIAATAAEPDPPPGEGVRLPKDLMKSHSGMEANGPFLLLPITYLCHKSQTRVFNLVFFREVYPILPSFNLLYNLFLRIELPQ
jgi:hypothetical protein